MGPRLLVHENLVIAVGEQLAVIDLHTGKVAWSVAVPRPLTYGAVVADADTVFIADLGEAAAYDLHTGARRWHHRFPGEGTGVVGLAVPGMAMQGDLR